MSLWRIKDELGNPSRPQKTMFLISAFFDPLTNRTLQNLINGIADVTGNQFMLEFKVPPHLTFLQIQTRTGQEQLEQAVENLEGKLKPVPLTFASCGDGIPNVVFAKVRMTDELKAQINLVYEEIIKIPDIKINPHYLPENIFPHVTLGKTLNREQQAAAMDYVNKNFSMFSGTIASAALTCGKPPYPLVNFPVFN
ncbi:MAG: 2'-5' RNA ligase family protein [Treponema sp.]|nr:2'-5' RNA ligase family protein [Treponema sp.]